MYSNYQPIKIENTHHHIFNFIEIADIHAILDILHASRETLAIKNEEELTLLFVIIKMIPEVEPRKSKGLIKLINEILYHYYGHYNILSQDNLGNTLLHYAAYYGYQPIINQIVKITSHKKSLISLLCIENKEGELPINRDRYLVLHATLAKEEKKSSLIRAPQNKNSHIYKQNISNVNLKKPSSIKTHELSNKKPNFFKRHPIIKKALIGGLITLGCLLSIALIFSAIVFSGGSALLLPIIGITALSTKWVITTLLTTTIMGVVLGALLEMNTANKHYPSYIDIINNYTFTNLVQLGANVDIKYVAPNTNLDLFNSFKKNNQLRLSKNYISTFPNVTQPSLTNKLSNIRFDKNVARFKYFDHLPTRNRNAVKLLIKNDSTSLTPK